MGKVSITNAIGTTIKILEVKVNVDEVLEMGTEIGSGSSGSGTYDGKSWQDFDRLIISCEIEKVKYRINLDRAHYFGGGDYRYPGFGSDVCYTLIGESIDQKQIRITLGYRQAGALTYRYSGDFTKNLDRN